MLVDYSPGNSERTLCESLRFGRKKKKKKKTVWVFHWTELHRLWELYIFLRQCVCSLFPQKCRPNKVNVSALKGPEWKQVRSGQVEVRIQSGTNIKPKKGNGLNVCLPKTRKSKTNTNRKTWVKNEDHRIIRLLQTSCGQASEETWGKNIIIYTVSYVCM